MITSQSSRAAACRLGPLGKVGLVRVLHVLGALAVAITVTLIAAYTGDFWATPEEGAFPGLQRNLLVARITIFVSVLAGALLLPSALRRVPPFALGAFVSWTTYLGGWLLGQWPGLVEPDTTEMLVQTRRGVAWEWFSWVQSLLNFVALDLVPHVAAIGVLQVVLMAALLSYVTWLLHLRSSSRWPVLAFCAVAGLSAPLVSYSIHLVRDTVFAIGHVLLALIVGRVVVERRVERRTLLTIATLLGLLSAYRGDGPILAVVVPIVLVAAVRPSRRQLLSAGATLVSALALFHVVLPGTLSIRQDNPHVYGMTLRMNPLGAVLKTDWYADDKDAVLAGLSRVIDVEKVRAQQDPVNIPAYWDGAWNYNASEEDWLAFERATTKLFVSNPAAFLSNRVQVFLASSGLAPGAFRGTEYIYRDPALRVVSERDLEPADVEALTATPPSPGLYDLQQRILHWASDYRGFGPAGPALHWNLVPWLTLLIVVLLRFRSWPFEATIALIILSRVPLVALVAPIAQFKYYNSVHLGGLVVLGLLLTRLQPDTLRRLVPARLARPGSASVRA